MGYSSGESARIIIEVVVLPGATQAHARRTGTRNHGIISHAGEVQLETQMVKEPIHVTDEAFESKVLGSNIPVVVDFWAPWCGPCRMVAPVLDKLAEEYSGKLMVAKVNTDENPEWAGKYGVQGIPTMLFIANGKLIHQQVGAVPESYLRDMVEEFLGAVEEVSVN
jgi:thioredoxin 1